MGYGMDKELEVAILYILHRMHEFVQSLWTIELWALCTCRLRMRIESYIPLCQACAEELPLERVSGQANVVAFAHIGEGSLPLDTWNRLMMCGSHFTSTLFYDSVIKNVSEGAIGLQLVVCSSRRY